MIKRLRDSEWEIRQSCLQSLVDVAMADLTSLSEDAFFEMAERMKDKKPSIRRSAMTSMAKLYSRYISGNFIGIDELQKQGTLSSKTFFGISSDAWKRLRIVPEYIISCWGFPEFVDKQLVIQVIIIIIVIDYNTYYDSADPRANITQI